MVLRMLFSPIEIALVVIWLVHAAANPPVCHVGDQRTQQSHSVDFPCNIPRIHMQDITLDQFLNNFLGQAPVIIEQGLAFNALFRSSCSLNEMLRKYGNETIQLGTANTYTGRTSKRVKLQDYISYMTVPQPEDRWGNASWYLFGDTPEPFWDELLASYKIPYFAYEQRRVDPGLHITPAFGLGGVNSGVPFHTHGGGWSEVLHGKKRWFLFPKEVVPKFDPDRSQWQWTQETYPSILTGDTQLFECVIVPGETLYFPQFWYHATLNLAPYTSFVSAFA